MHRRKVGIIGAGAVGATAAYSLCMMGTCNEIVLFDIVEGVAKGKAIDIASQAIMLPTVLLLLQQKVLQMSMSVILLSLQRESPVKEI